MKKTNNDHLRIIIVLLLALDVIILSLLFAALHNVNELSKTLHEQQTKIATLTQQEVKPFKTNILMLTQKEKTIEVVKPLDQRELINKQILEICNLQKYSNVEPELVMSIVEQESTYNPRAKNGDCLGLMQVSSYWHSKRASKLGVTDFYDPYSNLLVGIDYLSDLIKYNKDYSLVLMLYSMDNSAAYKLHAEGKVTKYARTVLARVEEYKKRE